MAEATDRPLNLEAVRERAKSIVDARPAYPQAARELAGEDVPALVVEVERLRAECDRLRELKHEVANALNILQTAGCHPAIREAVEGLRRTLGDAAEDNRRLIRSRYLSAEALASTRAGIADAEADLEVIGIYFRALDRRIGDAEAKVHRLGGESTHGD